MNRDNILFTVIGLLTGFIAGYVMHEVMAERQPPRRIPGTAAEVGRANPAAAPAAAGGAPAMEAVQRLSRRVAENPDDAEAVKQLAEMNYNIANWSRAIELYEHYLELSPDDLDAMTDLGASYRGAGNVAGALDLFREVRERFPDHWQARYNEILVLAFDLGELKAASREVAELQALEPDNSDIARLAAEIERRRQAG
ncbi:MAG: tetratricopeptide repeat protein [Thermoanaerobaculia bacterium]